MGYFWAIFTSTTTFLKKNFSNNTWWCWAGVEVRKKKYQYGPIPLPSPVPPFPFRSYLCPSWRPGCKRMSAIFWAQNTIWWQRNCLYVLQSSQSGGMVSSRPMKCRYAILTHFEHWRWEELVHMTSSIASSKIKLDNNVRASSNLSSRELQEFTLQINWGDWIVRYSCKL